jgi:hypothetical protein
LKPSWSVRGDPVLGTALAVVLCLASTPAGAQVTKEQCIDANGRAQHLRSEAKLQEAREQLRTCSNPVCPVMGRSDCTKRLDDLETAQPTIAFEAKDGAGADVVAVKVTVDGKPLADRLDGTPLPIDPGQHVFTFEMAGQPAVTRTLVLTEGEKGRREPIVLGPVTAPVPAPTPAPPAPGPTEPAPRGDWKAEAPRPDRGRRRSGGHRDRRRVRADDALGEEPAADRMRRPPLRREPHAGARRPLERDDRQHDLDRGVIAGAALVAGAVLFFTAGPSAQQPATGMLFTPSVGPGGGGVLLKGAF